LQFAICHQDKNYITSEMREREQLQEVSGGLQDARETALALFVMT